MPYGRAQKAQEYEEVKALLRLAERNYAQSRSRKVEDSAVEQGRKESEAPTALDESEFV